MENINCGRILLENTMKDLIILKSNRPKRMTQVQNRLNKALKYLAILIVEKAVEDHFFNPKLEMIKLEEMYGLHLKEIFMIGFHEVSPKKGTLRDVPVMSLEKLDKIVDKRVFKASEATMQRLTGKILPHIKEGIQEGKALGKTVKSLKKDFQNMTNHELMRIVRTETHSIYNQSKYESLLQANVPLKKQWLSSGLSNSRPAHEDADGQTVGVDEPFIVDGEELMYPGDPSGSPENVINCACTIKPVIQE
jgi:hypothetical protein